MTVQELLPTPRVAGVESVIAQLQNTPSLEPFSPEILSFCAGFSQRILRDPEARKYGELQALGFWMRRAELQAMAGEFRARETDRLLPAPRGLVFHIPPSNVDTIFVYSWLLSVLAGNRNVIRISSRESVQTSILMRLFGDALADAPDAVRFNTVMLRYGHEESINAALSMACDMRVVWGGDATVDAFRKFPLRPHARELTFPDRYSLAAIRVDRYLGLNEAARSDLAVRFFNDIFWFDQMACSSPQLLVWAGDRSLAQQAAGDFYARLREVVVKKGHVPAAATALQKLAFACRAVLDGTAAAYEHENHVTVLGLASLPVLRRDHCGGGLLFQYVADSLNDLRPGVTRQDQTLAAFGWNNEELKRFVRGLAGRGIDRIVPFGQALQFERVWDGYDLLGEFTRLVSVRADACDAEEVTLKSRPLPVRLDV